MDEQTLRRQLAYTLGEATFPGLGQHYRGKVRDTYRQGDRLVLITSDRISAFDRVLGTVPFKGEILNRTAAFWFEQTRDIARSHLLSVPDPNVMVGRACEPLPIELVVRGYLTGSLWRDYEAGRADVYGVRFAEGLRRDERFPQPVITPTTKEAPGRHDEPISRQEIVRRGLVSAEVLERACAAALALFARGQEVVRQRGLILVDTKYEFGLAGGELLVIDEIHTMDSSRYWEAAEYEERFREGRDQKMLDKENVRQWLLRERGFSGHGEPPPLPDEVRIEIARIYIAAFERITGMRFEPEVGDVRARIERNLKTAGLL